uniref:RING-type E3 ubiquitin transferase n=1 Tax=Leersia perrieri TaxID=77586 RepID=A0A0D9WQX5_9ORYZ
MPGGGSASSTLQYTGIGAFIAIVGVVVLAVIYYSRSGSRTPNAAALPTQQNQQQQRGLGPDDVSVLPTFTYHATASPGGRRCGGLIGRSSSPAAAECCAVCLEELGEGAVVRMLPSCKHYFHATCVDVWLLSRASCPVCRGSPGQEKVRLGLASLSPPLPQLLRCPPSPPKEGSAANGGHSASRSQSPMRSPPSVRLDDLAGAGIEAADRSSPAMSPSPTRARTPESGARVSRSPSPVTTTATTTDLNAIEV